MINWSLVPDGSGFPTRGKNNKDNICFQESVDLVDLCKLHQNMDGILKYLFNIYLIFKARVIDDIYLKI